jgi:exodeoxyribonuclease VII large subunit
MTLDVEAKPKALTISELNRAVKGHLEGDFGDVWVQGEISDPRTFPSGHTYFKLKDAGAQISAAIFRGDASNLKFKLEHGMEVLARGRVTLYEARGSFQIVCRHIEPQKQGALQLAFEQLKKKLAAEGLFEDARKKPLPAFPERIGLVTSRQGAAVRDMLAVLKRRFTGLHIRLMPVLVQGEGSALQVAEAVNDFNKYYPDTDVLLVGRGGGSLEDLWAFNEEPVARAIADSSIPVISCVGHETDFTIADFVSDKRAPTPSAAAELVVQEKEAIAQHVDQLSGRLARSISHVVQALEDKLKRLASSPSLLRPERIFELQAQRINDLKLRLWNEFKNKLGAAEERLKITHRLPGALRGVVAQADADLRRLMEKLDTLSPLKVLGRGYAIAFKDGRAVRQAREVAKGDKVKVRVGDGDFNAVVEG